MKTTERLFLLFVISHIAIILLNASGINKISHPFLNGLFLTYCNFSGTDTKYGYFSPNVADDFDVVYTLYKEGAQVRQIRLEMSNEECRQRLYTMYNYFYRIDESRDLMARSLALAVLKNFPDCDKVKIELFLYRLPKMGDYQKKNKPFWELFYSVEFEIN